MKADILNLEGAKVKSIDLPKQFEKEIRLDIIKKDVLAIQANARQSYGASPEAGLRHATYLSKRRRAFKTSYGHGISRTPRKTTWQRGRQFGWVGAFAPNTRGGRRSHPPKAVKDWSQKINIKEKRKAICSAISSSINKQLLEQRGFPTEKIPLIIEQKFEDINKTKDLKSLLTKLGLKDFISIKRTIRAGKGSNRGRKYKNKIAPLIVVSKKCSLTKASQNFVGFDTCTIDYINTELLAPGTVPGRLVLWSLPAIERLEKEKLFMQNKPKTKQENGSL